MQDNRLIPVIRFRQWLDAWNDYDFDAAAQRRKPRPYIYLFGMAATKLRALSDVYRRERSVTSAEGIQRAREDDRTARIKRYIEAGYPYGDLRTADQSRNENLKKPGWLPTAIVMNVLTQDDLRRGRTIANKHMAEIVERDKKHYLRLPNENDMAEMADDQVRPFEVIDGQHRLWAFDNDSNFHDFQKFEVPVVAFVGLDVAWQAYLFWSINISPKRINPSHAFDLYPLLRTQDWLEKTGEITVYREARAQEITEWLYRYSESVWRDRISMLQRKGEARVSQAAWVRSLIGSFFSTGRGRGGRRGLFQCAYDNEGSILNWERIQQIAFIAEFWSLVKRGIDKGEHDWIKFYCDEKKNPFTDKSSMLNQDMGVRAVHAVLNDIFFRRAGEWKLDEWDFGIVDKTITTNEGIEDAISSLKEEPIYIYLKRVAQAIAGFDWRSLDGPGVRSSDEERTKRVYRGSGGYTELIKDVMGYIHKCGERSIADPAELHQVR